MGCNGTFKAVCRTNSEGECVVNCGSGLYRDGNTCRYCNFIGSTSTTCTKCGTTAGTCAACKPGYGLTDNACFACTGNTYSTGTTCLEGVDKCSLSDHTKAFCQQCFAGFAPQTDGSCGECVNGTYSLTGKECIQITNCRTAVSTKIECTVCDAGYEPRSNGSACGACEGNTYSEDGTECVLGHANCSECNHTSGVCTTCEAGFEPDAESGGCRGCEGNTYSENGVTCVEGHANCKVSKVAQKWCMECDKGFEISAADGSCRGCEGNTYSVDGVACVALEHCVAANPAQKECRQCERGYAVGENRTCVACGTGTYSADGVACRACSETASCVECRAEDGWCTRCTDGLLVSAIKNECRLCTEGEEATETTCELCKAGTYSVDGVKCTSDCGAFGISTCLKTGFCKLVQDKCVSDSNNSVQIIIGAGASTVGLILILLIVLVILWKVGYFARRRARREERMVAEMAAAVFETCTLSVDVKPDSLTFGGQPPPKGATIREYLTVDNQDTVPVRFALTDLPASSEYEVTAPVETGVVEAGERVQVAVLFRRWTNREVVAGVRVVVQDMGFKTNGRAFDVGVQVGERSTYALEMKDITLGEVIGNGTYGKVYRGVYNEAAVAVKVPNRGDERSVELFGREVEMMKTVHGRNVVVFVGAVTEGGDLCHVTELMDLGTLEAVQRAHRLGFRLKMKVLGDVARGMATLHSFSVVHRDLKPDNVLLKSPLSADNPELCKVTDFGTSRVAENVFAMTMTHGLGTPLYMAPEILSGQRHYSGSVDVYSYGVLMASVWNDGAVPYAEYSFQNPLELQNAIVTGIRPSLMYDMPLEMGRIYESALSADPSERPAFTEIVRVVDALFPLFVE